MSTKTWKHIEWSDECPDCGSGVEVLTDESDGRACDGDEARCEECGRKGYVTVCGFDEAYVNWDV